MKTLIVEDVHFLALILERIIVPFGPVDFASNGRIAIDLYSKAFTKNDPYDLVCLDLLLPEVDGFEVLYHIRHFEDSFNLPEEGRIKIIVISTFNDSKTVTRARKAGCDGYIAKPFRKDKIIEELRAQGLIPSAEDDP